MGYLKAYAAGATLGILSEIIVSKGQHHCLKNFTGKCALSATFLNLYGWAAVLLTYLMNKFNCVGWNIIPFTIIAIILVTIMECIGGKLSYFINNGKKTWNYPQSYMCACDGYVSVLSSAYFGVLVLIFAYFVYPYVKK